MFASTTGSECRFTHTVLTFLQLFLLLFSELLLFQLRFTILFFLQFSDLSLVAAAMISYKILHMRLKAEQPVVVERVMIMIVLPAAFIEF